MKHLSLALLLIAGTVSAKDVADFARIPGAKVIGACHPYALAVETTLRAKGIEAYYVAYRHAHGEHAVVVFRVGKKWRMVDNENAYSFSVRGNTVLALCRCLNSSASKVVESAVPLPLQ